MRTAVLVCLLAGDVAFAARPQKAAPVPAPAPAQVPEDPSSVLLQRAKELYASLEYDKVIPLTEVALQRDDLPLDDKLEAHRLNGCAKAIVQDPVDAEKPFRLLLRLKPHYDLPKDTAPKILAVFRKVQTEERALAEQAELFNREQKKSGLKFLDEPPSAAKGGKPVPFTLRLRDPGAAVDAVIVPYRRQGQPSYSSLALQRDEEGRWVGQIPAEYTADEKGFTLEYYVETSDAKGPLLSQGSAALPLKLEVSAGKAQSGKPPPVSRKVFFSMLGMTLGGAAVSGALGIATKLMERQYQGLSGMQMGSEVLALERRGDATALAANIGWIVTGALAIVTAILVPLTDWDAAAQ